MMVIFKNNDYKSLILAKNRLYNYEWIYNYITTTHTIINKSHPINIYCC